LSSAFRRQEDAERVGGGKNLLASLIRLQFCQGTVMARSVHGASIRLMIIVIGPAALRARGSQGFVMASWKSSSSTKPDSAAIAPDLLRHALRLRRHARDL
jgi:hypothetical protein